MQNGFLIRGGDGLAVFLHEGHYVAEHYRILDGDESARVLWRSEPFEARRDAEVALQEYRRAYGQ